MNSSNLFEIRKFFLSMNLKLKVSPLDQDKMSLAEINKLEKRVILQYRQGKPVNMEEVSESVQKIIERINKSFEDRKNKFTNKPQAEEDVIIKEHGDFYGETTSGSESEEVKDAK